MPTFLEPTFLEPDPGLIQAGPPRIAAYRNVMATPFLFLKEDRTILGSLYEESGALIRRAQRIDKRIRQCDPELFVPSSKAKIVKGQGYYIGHIMDNYGHFITEGVSSCWATNDFEIDYFVAHPFIWGSKIPEFAQFALRRIGIPPERIRIVQQETRFESLIVPDRLWHISRSVNRRFDAIVDKITAGYLRSRPGLKLYLSRSKMRKRTVSNEREMEDLFRRAGFVVLHPQDHSFPAQLELFGQAAVLAGLAGSALHNIIFCPKGAATISIGDSRATVTPNQLVCGALAGSLTAAIPFAGGRRGFHIPTLARELTAVLEHLGDLNWDRTVPEAVAATKRTPYRTVRAWMSALRRRHGDSADGHH